MKKTITLISVLLMLTILLAGCGADKTQTTDVIGTWELTSVKLNGMTYVDADILGDYDYTFTFTDDGSATATVMGVSYTTTYTVKDGWVTFAHADLASIRLEMEGDNLTMELTKTGIGGGLVFTRK